jgi:hypothetical protein
MPKLGTHLPESVSFEKWHKHFLWFLFRRRRGLNSRRTKNGIAQFPRVTADQFAVSVLAKGYKPCWHWNPVERF